MRHLLSLSLASTAIALAAACLPIVAAAQEAAQPDEPVATFASPLADATWTKRYVPLDEDTLGRQRGRAPGAVTVSAPQLVSGGTSVTLWDEIAPPAPMPIPVDAQRAMQGNNASYTRK
ncbi:hypothetical protein [Burkholderia ubonensis]|uniref:hypothetical protein n=1 Tax=Burkholderia ubonensis TaxID=101571 RepID=UPI001E419A1A|nr:hypothetical protein [Burkholderia ubonensis]